MGRVNCWLKCIHKEATIRFVCETSLPFCFVLPWLKSSLVYIIFRTPTRSLWSHHPLTRCTRTRLSSSMRRTELTRHFRWGTTCVFFTLGNRYISCYATYATYAASQRNILVDIEQCHYPWERYESNCSSFSYGVKSIQGCLTFKHLRIDLWLLTPQWKLIVITNTKTHSN